MTGAVCYFNDEKGFGFISPDQLSGNVFFHRNDCDGAVAKGDRVSFDVGENPRDGREKALCVRVIERAS
jgi:cold shock protein